MSLPAHAPPVDSWADSVPDSSRFRERQAGGLVARAGWRGEDELVARLLGDLAHQRRAFLLEQGEGAVLEARLAGQRLLLALGVNLPGELARPPGASA